MKTFLSSVIFLIFLNTSCFVWAKSYSCQAGRQNLVKFKLDVQLNQVKIYFSSTQNDIASDLAGKVLTLKPEKESAFDGWIYFTGKTIVDTNFADYRHIQFGYVQKSLNSTKLQGNFSMSPPSSMEEPRWMDSFDLNCK